MTPSQDPQLNKQKGLRRPAIKRLLTFLFVPHFLCTTPLPSGRSVVSHENSVHQDSQKANAVKLQLSLTLESESLPSRLCSRNI